MSDVLLDRLLEMMNADHGSRLVQMVVITINGVKHLYVGPVIPELFVDGGTIDIQDIHFGDVVKTEQAIRLLSKEFLEGQTVS
jgi:hypothetical protein